MNLKSYLKKAQKEHWAIGQFNFSTHDQLRAIFIAAEELKSPVILGTSEGEIGFLGIKETVALVEILKAKHKVNAFLNLDHGKDMNLLKKAADLGYSAVHFDGSGLSLKENIKNTKKIAEYAHKRGVLVEGELGRIKGESVFHKEEAVIKEEELTSPDEVKMFLKETKADSLAVAIGNIHGVYKGGKNIDLERLKEISLASNAFLVLHGGSDIKESDIKEAVKLGIVKININTELRIIWKESLINSLKTDDFKPYKILPQVQNLIKEKVEEKINMFGSNGKQ